MPVTLPCGQCIGCRLERSRQMAIRCVHESKLHDENSFVTLTYNEQSLPRDSGLCKPDFQKFMKRFRRAIAPRKIRYFHCGEYGDENNRPHYHAIIFGHDFADKTLYGASHSNNKDNLYHSDFLDHLWQHGTCLTGEVTFESCAYVARYVLKKIKQSEKTPDKYDYNYERVDPDTGECFQVEPEYVSMSLKPGIGQGWYDKYAEETYRDDYIIHRGIKMQPPRFYDNQWPEIHHIKKRRKRKADERIDDHTLDRLHAAQVVKSAQIKNLKRSLQEF